MSNYERKKFNQVRLEWTYNGVSGHGDWFDWSPEIEAALLTHVQEGHKPATGKTMCIGVRTVVESVKVVDKLGGSV